MLFLAFAGRFSPGHRLLLLWQTRHSMSCQVSGSCKELHVPHAEGMQSPGARTPPLGPPETVGWVTASLLGSPGSACGLESEEVPLFTKCLCAVLRHQTSSAPSPYRGEASPNTHQPEWEDFCTDQETRCCLPMQESIQHPLASWVRKQAVW